MLKMIRGLSLAAVSLLAACAGNPHQQVQTESGVCVVMNDTNDFAHKATYFLRQEVSESGKGPCKRTYRVDIAHVGKATLPTIAAVIGSDAGSKLPAGFVEEDKNPPPAFYFLSLKGDPPDPPSENWRRVAVYDFCLVGQEKNCGRGIAQIGKENVIWRDALAKATAKKLANLR